MPDNTRPPRNPRRDDPPTLMAKVVMDTIRDIPQVKRLVGVEVRYRMNAQGQHVVAVIFPPQPAQK